MSDSDPDFWDIGNEDNKSRKRRGFAKKKSGFTYSETTNESSQFITSGTEEEGPLVNGSAIVNGEITSGTANESSDPEKPDIHYDSHQYQNGNNDEDSESDNLDEDSQAQEDRAINKKFNHERNRECLSSNRSSLLSADDLPRDYPKGSLSSDRSSRNQKASSNESQWMAEEFQLPPQQKLKLALYRGRKLMSAKQADSAITQFVRAQALARIVHGDQHWRYCRCKVFLAQAYLYLKEYAPQAETQAKEALDTLTLHLGTTNAPDRKPQVHHTLFWGYLVAGEARCILGNLQTAQESYNYALHHSKIYMKMVSRRKKLTPSLTMDRPVDLYLKILCAQASLYTKRAKFTKAKEKLLSGIECVEKDGGARDSRLVAALQQLGQLLLDHCGQDDTEEGLRCLTRATTISQASNGPGSIAECESRVLLVKYQLRLRRVDATAALSELHKLMSHYTRLHGEHSTKTMGLHSFIIQVLLQEEDYEQAIDQLKVRLMHCRDAYGDYSTQVCGVLRQLSRVHTLSGNMSAAATALDQSLTAESHLYGTSSRRAQASRARLSEIIPHIPLALRMKLWRKHPELQNKPRFRNL